MIRQWDLLNNFTRSTAVIDHSETRQSVLSKRLMFLWLVGLVILLPVDIIHLPLNMALVDVWILAGLPLLWLSFLRGPQVISVSYTIPMWLILIGSFVSTLAAPAPMNSMIVILKEVYVFIWFITVIAVLSKLDARDFRLIMIVWSAVVLLHGCLMIAQFLSPDFWRLTAGYVGRLTIYERFRPSGLFVNANLAAFFQLLGFVPLVLVSRSKKVTMTLGLLLLLTMLLTGSMGATIALATGMMVAIFAISFSGRLAFIIKMFAQLAVIMLFFGALLAFFVSHNARYKEHFEHILIGRSERSSEGRFDLWRRGLDTYIERDVFLWGVGPENFREVDPKMTDNQLHNDFLAFSVERGLLGTVGLILFAIVAVSRATYLLLLNSRYSDRSRLVVVVFLAAMAAVMVESLTHQVFHFRELWLVLAFQEAMLYKMTASKREVDPPTRPLVGLPYLHRGFVGQPDVIQG